MQSIEINYKRGSLVESSHNAKLLVTDLKGKTLISTGNDNDLIFPRSSIKIFQAIPFISSGVINKFKLNSKIIALSCSSHRGEYYHIKELQKWLKIMNIKEGYLKCGCHYPLNHVAKEKILRSNKKINQLYNNCAGKHLAMISSCIMMNYNINNYLMFEHAHQKNIRKIFEVFSEKKITKKNFGIDGCSAPQYAFKIKNINKLLINLIKSYKGKFEKTYETKLLIDSIIKNPKYIGGNDSLDSKIMEISKGNIFCKGGAEGVFLFINLKKEISGVIKINDGNERAIPYLILDLFKKFKIMDKKNINQLNEYYKYALLNHAKIKVGNIEIKI